VILNQLLLTKYHINLLIYAAIIGISHAAEFYRRYREREHNLSQLETLLAQAQLSALRMQLQPHFLFNALNSLADLIERDGRAANKMVARLGDFLRLTLQSPDTQEVTLANEIEYLMHYLEIEKLRYEGRLRVQMDIAPETDLALIPHLILQPLVENAIRHGIAQLETDGVLEIRSWRVEEMLCLQVRDNGPGLANEKQTGVGLRNTQARLQKLYGARQRFEMRNVSAGGVEVSLQIPFLESSESHA
jgi:LytS/YehU family sensor histidine kinase